MRTARACLVAFVLLAPQTLGGCGDGATDQPVKPPPHESPAAHAVRAAVQGWLASLATPKNAGDSARACAHLTPGLRRSIDLQLRMRGEKGRCKTFAAKWTGGTTPPGQPDARVSQVSVTGGKALVTLEASPDKESAVQLIKMHGRWLIENY